MLTRPFVLLFLLLTACNPYKALRPDSFRYTVKEVPDVLSLQVPKGYVRKSGEKDTTGVEIQTYAYRNGAVLYVAYHPLGKPSTSFDTAYHVGRLHQGGGLFYKGQDPSSGRFYSEVLLKNFRFGYRGASSQKQEALLDSALNSVRVK